MPRGRPKGSRNKPATPRAGGDARLLQGVRELVARNAELETENARLRRLLDEISSQLSMPARAGRATAPTTGPRRRGRPPKSAAAKRPRRKITDPEVLEKRRQALAKARAVRAEKRAAAQG